MIKNQYEENGYLITEYESGAIVKEIISEPLVEQPAVTPAPTLEEQIAELKEQNLILMDALATIFETIMTGGT